VRRAWLWGVDEYAGKDYSHRKKWVLDRLTILANLFAIDVCAYAVMSDHYHLVLHVDEGRAKTWTSEEVIQRWTRLFRAPQIVERTQSGVALEAEQCAAHQIIECWRERLYDLSWFMRCLNEHLARMANAEDQCTGRFWEGRFKSQALLDEAALLTAMAYVDLNPVRAGIAAAPEASPFTSIYERIKRFRNLEENDREGTSTSPRVPLLPFRGDATQHKCTLPYRLHDYLQLVDWTGRSIRDDKPGFVDSKLPPLLSRLSIDDEVWRVAMRRRGSVFGRAMGRLDLMRLHATTLGQAWVRGMRQAERLYS
jgi:hypothetical protein